MNTDEQEIHQKTSRSPWSSTMDTGKGLWKNWAWSKRIK